MGGVRVSHVGGSYALVGDSGEPFAAVAGFLGFLRARRCSPNTEAAYAYDLAHFFRFLDVEQITYQEFTPPRALRLLSYLRELPNRSRARRLRLVPVVEPGQERAAPGLAPSTVNHIISTVSAFYEYLIPAGEWTTIVESQPTSLSGSAPWWRSFSWPLCYGAVERGRTLDFRARVRSGIPTLGID